MHLWAGEGEEGVGAVGQEELQGGRLQQEACVVQLSQRGQGPPLVRARRPLRAAADRRTPSGMRETQATLTGLCRVLSCGEAMTGHLFQKLPPPEQGIEGVTQGIKPLERAAYQAHLLGSLLSVLHTICTGSDRRENYTCFLTLHAAAACRQ